MWCLYWRSVRRGTMWCMRVRVWAPMAFCHKVWVFNSTEITNASWAPECQKCSRHSDTQGSYTAILPGCYEHSPGPRNRQRASTPRARQLRLI